MNKYLLSSLGFFLFNVVCAQPPNPPGTPIDGGLGVLLAGGIAYGISRIKKSKQQ